MRLNKIGSFLLIIAIAVGCSSQSSSKQPAPSTPDSNSVSLSSHSAGLDLPAGFKATIVADNIGAARHITIAENGDIYIGLRHKKNGGGIVALRDTTNDGKADIIKYFGEHRGTGIGLYHGYLYHSSPKAVYRIKMKKGALVPEAQPEVVVKGFHRPRQEHAPKAFTFDGDGHIYVNVGAPSNSCQETDRTKASPGQGPPCPLLENWAGIWRYDANKLNQTKQGSQNRYATGLRNVVGLDWNEQNNTLYVMQHGRDQLYQNWPKYYNAEESAKLPAEEMFKVNKGDNFGWPYSYYNLFKHKIMLAPEYGGNGKTTIDETQWKGKFEPPVMAFPGHWAPDGMVFYYASQFPEKYRNGAFIAFHGSWNRAPKPQAGFNVVFVPFKDGKAAGNYFVFADGFTGPGGKPLPGGEMHRPTGVTIGPKGSLFITDDSGETVWKITYVENQ